MIGKTCSISYIVQSISHHLHSERFLHVHKTVNSSIVLGLSTTVLDTSVVSMPTIGHFTDTWFSFANKRDERKPWNNVLYHLSGFCIILTISLEFCVYKISRNTHRSSDELLCQYAELLTKIYPCNPLQVG